MCVCVCVWAGGGGGGGGGGGVVGYCIFSSSEKEQSLLDQLSMFLVAHMNDLCAAVGNKI